MPSSAPERGMGVVCTLTPRHGIVAGVPVAVKTTVTELPDSRVRLQVEVPLE